MVSCCVLLAEGFEELEAVTVVDVLRRAGVDVTTLGTESTHPNGSHGISLAADGLLTDHAGETWDLVVLPGGMPGSAHLRDDPRVQALVARQGDAGKWLAAICAGPIALESAGVLEGRRATSYPGFGEQLSTSDYCDDRVCVDGHIVTSRGPGTALEFALTLVSLVVGQGSADELAEAMLVRVETLA
jgi:4-methyl-5(b-hydroxyethyl)-thiazole monophosphate biosynthesis